MKQQHQQQQENKTEAIQNYSIEIKFDCFPFLVMSCSDGNIHTLIRTSLFDDYTPFSILFFKTLKPFAGIKKTIHNFKSKKQIYSNVEDFFAILLFSLTTPDFSVSLSL